MSLIIALPSKGRLKEQAEEFFAAHGFKVKTKGGNRDYVGSLNGIEDVTVQFLQASEIAKRLIEGSVDCGITGIDLIAEYKGDLAVHIFKKLNFGHADLVLAVPQSWIDVHTMSDFEEVSHIFRQRHGHRLRIATKYLHLTAQFFKQYNITDYRIVESQGATEGTPANITAEAIVDITSTGTTIAANHLKVLNDGLILKSEAVFSASMLANWNEEKKLALKHILDMVQAAEKSKEMVVLNAYGIKEIPNNLHIENISFQNNILNCLLKCSYIYPTIQTLQSLGVENIVLNKSDYIFAQENKLYKEFTLKL